MTPSGDLRLSRRAGDLSTRERIGLSSGRGLAPARSQQYAFVRLINERIDTALAAALGEALLRHWQAVPFQGETGDTWVAMADPRRCEQLEHAAGRSLTATLASATEIEATLDAFFGAVVIPAAEGALRRTLRALGLLTAEQEQVLREKGAEPGRPPGWALVQLNHLTEEELAQALALTFHLPYVRLQRWPVNTVLLRLISDLPRARSCSMPLLVVDHTLYLAVADPTDNSLLQQVERATGFHTVPVVVSVSAMEKSVARLSRRRGDEEEALEQLLVTEGLISDQRLKLAKEVAWHTGEATTQVLIRTGACTAAVIHHLRAKLQPMPLADLDRLRHADPALVSLLPRPLAERLHAVAYAAGKEGIHVAIAQAEHCWASDLVSYLAGRPAIAEAAPPAPVFMAIRQHASSESQLSKPNTAATRATERGGSAPAPGSWPRMSDGLSLERLELLLVRGGYVDRGDLARVGDTGRSSPASPSIGERLVASGRLSETDLAEALALHEGAPWLDRLWFAPPQSVTQVLPYTVAEALDAFPLLIEGNQATIAVAVLTSEKLAQLEEHTGRAVRPVFAPANALKMARDQYYHLDPAAVPPMFREFGRYLRERYSRTTAEVARFWRRTVLKGEPADIVLVEEGLLPSPEIPQALAAFLNVHLLDLLTWELTGGAGHRVRDESTPVHGRASPEQALVVAIPLERAKALAAVPIRRLDGSILVAFADPLDLAARSEIGSLLASPLTIVVAPRDQILAFLDQAHRFNGDSKDMD